jgi:hypothetical protein
MSEARRETRFEWWSGNIALALVLGNTIVLALDRYPIACAEAARLDAANFVFAALFVLEMGVKLAVLGVTKCGGARGARRRRTGRSRARRWLFCSPSSLTTVSRAPDSCAKLARL